MRPGTVPPRPTRHGNALRTRRPGALTRCSRAPARCWRRVDARPALRRPAGRRHDRRPGCGAPSGCTPSSSGTASPNHHRARRSSGPP